MSWNYRAIRHHDGSLAVHEVFYNEAGEPNSMTENPVTFSVSEDESIKDLATSLEQALNDIRKKPIIEASYFDPVTRYLVYIGQTNNFERRKSEHLKPPRVRETKHPTPKKAGYNLIFPNETTMKKGGRLVILPKKKEAE